MPVRGRHHSDECDLKLMETRVIVVVRLLCDAVSLQVRNLKYRRQNSKMVIMIEVDADTVLIRMRKIKTPNTSGSMNSRQNHSASFFQQGQGWS